MVTAILLAGGRSRRSGRQHKACRRLGSGPTARSWIDRQIDSLRAGGVARVRVVLGYRPVRVQRCLHRRVELRVNRRPALGPFGSLQAGLQSLSGAVLVQPLDIPVPARQDLRRLIGALPGADSVAPRRADGAGGHPVLLSQTVVRQLRAVEPWRPDARLDVQLRRIEPGRRRTIRVRSARAHSNLNTPRDWFRYRRSICRRVSGTVSRTTHRNF